MFKKMMVSIKCFFFAIPMFFSSLHAKKQPYEVVYETARLWTLMFLKFAKVKIKIHHKNYVPLKDGVLFVVLSKSSIDQEICLSSFAAPATFVLSEDKRLFLISKSWQNTLKSVVTPKIIDERHFKNNHNVVAIIDQYDKLNDTLLEYVMKYDYPIVLVDIENAQHALDEKVQKRVIVNVNFNIPIVSEEYDGLSIKQCKHALIERKEGNVYEHD